MRRFYLLLIAVSAGIFLTAPTLSAKQTKPVKKRPKECRTIDPYEFTSPPITILHPDSLDATLVISPVDIWFGLKLSDRGNVEDLQLVWMSSDDSSFAKIARDTLAATRFSTWWTKKYAKREYLYHIVQIRPLSWRASKDTRADSVPGSDTVFDESPMMKRQQKPVYPFAAMRAGMQGTVWITLRISESGDVGEAVVAKSCGQSLLDNAALLAAYHNKFLPARKNKRPVPVWVTYKVDFALKN